LEIREPLERQLGPLGRTAIEELSLSPGEPVLDVGCGIGVTPRSLAEAVGETGAVTAMDLLAAALELLRREAGPLVNVSFVCGDAETYPFEHEAFDAVFSRFGVMFFNDPRRAFSNLRRSLRPGGRLSFVCWRGLEENELDDLPLRAASAVLPSSLVDEARNAVWFSFSNPGTIRETLAAAGFSDIQIDPHDEWVGCGSIEATVNVCSRVGALGAILREHPHLTPAASSALRDCLAGLDADGGPRLRAATWIVRGRAPD
jgi:ubiquinone/menaquinone biosynthesis C-methylase UbiE